VTITTKDLSKEPPSSPCLRVGGYVLLARMADKGRAHINGTEGDYHFNCPIDNMLFHFKGVRGSDVRDQLKGGATNEEISIWLDAHGIAKSEEDKREWSDSLENLSFREDSKWKDWFNEETVRLGLDPTKATLFDLLEAEDRESFGYERASVPGGRS
jgi:hypothetical protein